MSDKWRNRLDELDSAQRLMIEGGYLSQWFARHSLTVTHPSFIGAFYGLLLSVALFLPLGYGADWQIKSWMIGWILYTLLFILMLSLLGGLSLQIIRMTGRLPVGVPRLVLFSTPFIGLILLTLSIGRSQDIAPWFGDLGLFLMTMPGPIYIHLSWAPRWRMFEMLEAGEDPFKHPGIKTKAELINDHELMEVVDHVSSEE